MPSVVYSMTVSIDGYIAGPNGEIGWSVPSEELHRFHNQRVRELGAHVCGRRLYETMLYWETAEEQPGIGEVEREFAQIWKPLPKVVFSKTLRSVKGNARLATRGIAEEIAELKREADGDIEVGGAGLASACAALGLIDEFCLFVSPVLLGAGTPYLSGVSEWTHLELVETQTFPSGVIYARYRKPREK